MRSLATTLGFEFGACPCGGGEFAPAAIGVSLRTPSDELYVISDFPCGDCPECGSRVHKAAALEEVEAILNDRLPTLPHRSSGCP